MRYRWNPWQDLHRLQGEMNAIFENHRPNETEPHTQERGWRPVVDIYEDVEHFLVTAELPGIDPQKVDLRIEDNQLTLQGSREMEYPERREGYHRLEREYGAFTRSFTLPTTVDSSKIHAEYKHGLLRISIPKRAEVMPKQIAVKITE